MAVSAAENEQTYQAASDSTDCNSHAKHNEDGNEGMLMDISEMKAKLEDKMETRESLQDINEMKATLEDMREMMKSLKDMREMMESLKDMRETRESLQDMREMMASLKDMRETKEIAETIKSLVHLLQRGTLHKDVVVPCELKTPHPDGGEGTSPSGGGQQQLCSDPPQLQHASLQAQSGNIPEICVVKKSPNLTAHQHAVYKSLIYVPRNFKEAVDWLIAVRGDDGMKNLKALGAALYDFYAHMSGRFTEVSDLDKVIRVSREFLEQEKLKKRRSVKRILIKLNDRLRKTPDQLAKDTGSADDTENEKYLQKKGLTADTIAEKLCCVVDACAEFLGRIKNRSHYKSAYSPQATWDASFSAHPETGVVIFVGIAPMLCASISSLNAAVFAAMLRFPPFIAYKRMQELIQALGYVEPECRAGMTASYVGDALEGFEETIIFLYELAGFWIFY
ncbi:hypothetical protein BBBOND_0104080 [Babesia bigemina]|uniref:Uncharacterized protein n=1 Tax=Babesia bigemina TaxID=5866 RepID=A0A061D551_BABBI|nr:hypothetical protein BBBOND_0104080 [Babesia bigemina]CDR94099.1 hypothetical protein BBBOND_0104080 [Babesia bigemina]|eukprot:XP_012766285.1 hypothetical protein BBBOND_0104080 [Babesia bigemina]